MTNTLWLWIDIFIGYIPFIFPEKKPITLIELEKHSFNRNTFINHCLKVTYTWKARFSHFLLMLICYDVRGKTLLNKFQIGNYTLYLKSEVSYAYY